MIINENLTLEVVNYDFTVEGIPHTVSFIHSGARTWHYGVMISGNTVHAGNLVMNGECEVPTPMHAVNRLMIYQQTLFVPVLVEGSESETC